MSRLAGVSLCLLLILALVPVGCGSEAQSASTEDEDEVPALPVEIAEAASGDISAFFTGTATLVAEDETDVVAKSGGIVTVIHVEEGDYVRVGKVLAQLDDARLALEVTRAEAALNRLDADLGRNRALYERKLISSEEFERVEAEYDGQKAATDLARLALEHTTVRAPISGVISSRMVKVGNMVQTFAPTFRITSFTPLLAEMHVPERELNKLRDGLPVSVRADALPGESFSGHVERISPVVDAASGTFKVTVEIRDQTRRLKPGMFGRIGIVYDTHEDVILVPKASVMAEDDESAIFVVRGDTAFRQVIQRGFENDRFVEVVDGVDAGAQVITTGQSNLRDSSRVEVIH